MIKTISVAAAAAFLAAGAAPAIAGEKTAEYVIVNEDVGLPVFPHDISDRPYEVVGQIETDVRKATIFSKAPSQEKIYKELWERAEKMGADAVINAGYGDARVTMMSWGASKATGTAIRFVAAPAVPAPAAVEPAADTAVDVPAVAAEAEATVEAPHAHD